MPDSVETITQNIVNQIRATDPAFSFVVGSPELAIVEAVATQIAQAQVDFSVLDTQGNIDAMTGSNLDAYLNLFGFSRQLASSASGTVTFSTPADSPAVQDITIPFGTQVSASDTDPDTPQVYFTTTATVVLAQGTTSIDAPVIASTPGSIGNVAASTVNSFATLTGIPGVTTVSNASPMTGGVDFETDDQLRARFKNSIFRNMSGTYDQFMALALSGQNTTKANVIGPISRYQEYMQVPSADDTHMGTSGDPNGNYDNGGTSWAHKRTTAPSSNPYSKYTYAQQSYVTDGTVGGVILRPEVDYFFDRIPVNPASATRAALTTGGDGPTGNPKKDHQPSVTFLNNTGWPWTVQGLTLDTDSIVLVEHAYMSAHSRNSIPAGITNAVDVFVNGEQAKTIKSSEMYPHAGHTLQNTDPNQWTYYTNWKRLVDGSQPTVGANPNRLLPLFWQPLLSLPDSFTIKNANNNKYTFYKAKYHIGGEYYFDLQSDGVTGNRIANYYETVEVGSYYGTIRGRSGIEFRHKPTYGTGDGNTGTGPFANDTANSTNVFLGNSFTISYVIDQNIPNLQAIMEQNKQVTTDVLVHKSNERYFVFYITVMYTPGANATTTKALIDAQVQAYLENQYYGGVVQLSDVLQIVHNTPGVDNVRWTNEAIGTPPSGRPLHRVEEVNADGSVFNGTISDGFVSRTLFQGDATNHISTDSDFFLQDNELATVPTIPTTVAQVRSQNTWDKP